MSLAGQLARLHWTGPLSDSLFVLPGPVPAGDRVEITLRCCGPDSITERTWTAAANDEPSTVIDTIVDGAANMLAAEGIDADPAALLRGWP